MATAGGTLASTESAEWAICDAAFQAAESDLDGDIAAAQATMDGSVAGAQCLYDTTEVGFWSRFEMNTGDTPGNLGDTYNTNIASELATRQGVETANPNVTYDTSNLWDDPGYQSLILTADTTFDLNMQSHENDFDMTVQCHPSDSDSNMAGHTASYHSAIDTANSAWDSAVYGVEGAQETYDNSTGAAEDAYWTAVYDVGGIQEIYDNTILSSENQLAADIATTELTFRTTLAPAVTSYENTVAQAQSVGRIKERSDAAPASRRLERLRSTHHDIR